MMNYFKILVLLVFGVVRLQSAHSQTTGARNFKLFVNLENAPFDSLYLHDYTDGRHLVIEGKKTKAFTWELTIPDSVVANSENMQLLASRYSAVNNSSTWIRFIANKAGTESVIANMGLDNKASYLYGKYLRKLVIADEKIAIAINNKDTVISVIRGEKDRDTIGTIILEDFSLVVKDPHADVAVRSEDPFFSWFMDYDEQKQTYGQHLASYINLAKKHPDSRFYITNLANNLTKYRTKADVKKVYDNFSGKRKNTIWAKKIERFLYDKKFPNPSLPTVRANTSERVVQDQSKYNLVIFTASWCAPCREEIPLLKKIYADLGKNLILTYISIDEVQTAAAMKKLIREEKIPWRTLFAYKDIKAIKQQFFIEGIPQIRLIYPDQHIEIIEVRKDDDRAKLYALVKAMQNKKSVKNINQNTIEHHKKP